MATIELPESFRFLDVKGSKRLLTEGWGNPAGAAQGVLGMLVPADVSPLSDEGWGIVITYDADGYVNDDDAAKMNFDKLLKEMQEGVDETNKVRAKAGFEPVDLDRLGREAALRCEGAQVVLGEGTRIRRQPGAHAQLQHPRARPARRARAQCRFQHGAVRHHCRRNPERVVRRVIQRRASLHRLSARHRQGGDLRRGGIDRGGHCGQSRVLQGGVGRPAGLQEGTGGRSRRARLRC